ncbi:MAG: hypothetical protein IPM92_12510 [Saprospiraceae bacterium]|nr:hypothetical protein [Saprospiraceae bacterium]
MASILQDVAIASEALCLIISLYFFRKLSGTTLHTLPYILGFIFVSDLLGIILTQSVFKANKLAFNLPYYNLTTSIIIVMWTYLLIRNLKVGVCRIILTVALGIYLLFFALNIAFIQILFKSLHTYSFTLGSIVLCMAAVCYLKQLVESDRIIQLKKDVMFWIAVGLFSFYMINIPYMAMYNYLFEHYIDLLSAMRKVTIFLSYFMYLCIFFGLLCLKEKSFSVSS